MAFLPRGIDPSLLAAQVRNTAPYLFQSTEGFHLEKNFVPARVLRNFALQEGSAPPPAPLSHTEYFELCVSAHFLTCATPVPTDVDNQIRLKLWPEALSLEKALAMATFVLSSQHWPFHLVSTRWVTGFEGGPTACEILSGHLGEWFTIACAAYCALKRFKESEAKEIGLELFRKISEEVERHSEIFGSLWRGRDGLSCLKASANIAHNFGDLDRVMDMWNLDVGDPLRQFYKLGVKPFDSEGNLRYMGRLWVAGELYKSTIQGSSMALENHRHFALRKPKCLRKSSEFLIPFGPFMDDWGKKVGQILGTKNKDDLLEVIQALQSGASRMPKTFGYKRALVGIAQSVLNLNLTLDFDISLFEREPSQVDFENSWAQCALSLMDEIPSRA